MIIMKKIFLVSVISLMIFAVSGCGRNNEIQNSKSPSLSSEEIVNRDLAESGISRMRSIDDICVCTEPLVYREHVYNESGELVQYYQYEYDEFNRYKTVYNYQKNPETSEMVLFLQEDYSYDDYFYYKNTTYVQNEGLVTQDIYDTHNNIVMTQMPNKQYDDVSTITYTYKYPTDTNSVEEEYAYWGEGVNFSHYTIRRFNEYGDTVYIMTQYDDSVTTSTYEYEYDQENRMISMRENYVDEDIYGEDTSDYETVFTYDDAGLLISEEENYVSNDNSYYEIHSNKIIQFEYDDFGRLAKKITRHRTETGYSQFDESVYSVEYIYEHVSELKDTAQENQEGEVI